MIEMIKIGFYIVVCIWLFQISFSLFVGLVVFIVSWISTLIKKILGKGSD